MIVVAAEVAQPNVFQLGRIVRGDEFRRLAVAQMARWTGHALFQEGRVGAEAQHLLVVVGLDDEVVGFADVAAYCLGDVAHVGGESEAMRAILDEVAYVVGAVVGHLEGCDAEVAQLEGLLLLDDAACRHDVLLDVAALLDASVYVGSRIDGDVQFLAQIAHCLDVVGMVVRDQYRHDFLDLDAMVFQDLLDRANAYAGIDQDAELGRA